MTEFLKDLANSSSRVDPEDPSKGRKYDYFSFSILSKKNIYLNNEDESVGLTGDEKPDPSWR